MMEDDSLQRYHAADDEGKDTIVIEGLIRLFAERLPNEDITMLHEFMDVTKKEIK